MDASNANRNGRQDLHYSIVVNNRNNIQLKRLKQVSFGLHDKEKQPAENGTSISRIVCRLSQIPKAPVRFALLAVYNDYEVSWIERYKHASPSVRS